MRRGLVAVVKAESKNGVAWCSLVKKEKSSNFRGKFFHESERRIFIVCLALVCYVLMMSWFS